MKFFVMLSVLAISSTVFANAQEQRCEAKITNAIQATAKLMGVTEEIGFEIAQTGEYTNNVLGETLTKYSSSVFFTGDGYISNSGALVWVKMSSTSCDIVRLNVDIE